MSSKCGRKYSWKVLMELREGDIRTCRSEPPQVSNSIKNIEKLKQILPNLRSLLNGEIGITILGDMWTQAINHWKKLWKYGRKGAKDLEVKISDTRRWQNLLPILKFPVLGPRAVLPFWLISYVSGLSSRFSRGSRHLKARSCQNGVKTSAGITQSP